ncbi:glycoprotein-N-acetylgalactosamine 3-beta-galactosyltransferase 1-like [Macrobrachium nipponense]|uniref:glycoprotein-N-acetylgalactosamine 3-beta-galactosyltransferase 1-like n=1 Tax=Macrobrachium nipponense TaxID=159736 RepID=UPI0030C7C523
MNMAPISWSGIVRVMRMKKVTVAMLAVLGLIVGALTVHVAGTVYFYSDYLVLLLPDPSLPIMERHPDGAKVGANDLPVGRREMKEVRGSPETTRKAPRILCLIITSPEYHDERASHVAVTWARHCTDSVFLTTRRDLRLPRTILTPGASSYRQLWGKVKQGFEWAYNHRDDYDWVFKADDDTFVVIENLQAAVASLDPDEPQATGNHLSTWDRGSTYFNGGAGYVLSRGAVRKLVEEGLRSRACDNNLHLGTNEDVNMADCLAYLGVEFLDSRDRLKRQRFNVYPPQQLVDPRKINRIAHFWLNKVSVFPYKFGYSEMSDEVISFHYVDAPTMYLLYYLIYIVNPYNSDRSDTFQKLERDTRDYETRTLR